jgi:N-acetylmuramoyl-L-alanine amidase
MDRVPALAAAALLLLLAGCRTPPTAETPAASGEALVARIGAERGWAPLPDTLPPRAQFLAGLRICIDPGHGGDVGEEFERTRYKRGPTGLREAIANWETAIALRTLLERAGATVLLTRDGDEDVPIGERVRRANEFRADVFLSIHHNASARPEPNYSSLWYHGDGEGSPASLDIARALSDSLARVIMLPQARSNGIYSDTLMYPQGFGVLRGLDMPGVLAECSFFTNPLEEELLKVRSYNERMAFALFAGLADWAANGVPRWEPAPEAPRAPDGRTVTVRLADGMKEPWGSDGAARIRAGTVVATLDGEPLAHRLDGALLTVTLPAGAAPASMLDIRFENRAKNSSITPRRPLASLAAAPQGTQAPRDIAP